MRRSPNDGSVYRRKSDGRWVGAATLGYPEGRRKRKIVYGKTRREVQERLRMLQKSIADGLRVDVDRMTVGQFLASWLAESAAPGLRPKTLRTYETVVRVHLVPGLGPIHVTKLTVQQVQAVLNEKSAGGMAPRSVGMIRDVLRQALNVAIRWGLLGRNVAALTTAPRSTARERIILRPDQARTFVESIRGDRYEAVYLMALTSGLRQGEVLGLSWENVDFELGTVRVQHALSRDGRGARLGELKTERSRRVLAVGSGLLVALRNVRTKQLSARLLAGSRWVDSGLVFTTSIGTPLDGSSVTKELHLTLARADLPQITFHDLRHSCASLMLAQGVAPRVVMETLGHSDIRLTMNTYAHAIPELQRDAADRMDRLLSG